MTAQEAFTEWWADPLKFYARKSPDEQGTAKAGFKAGYRAGREAGRREGYAEALRDAVAAVEASRTWVLRGQTPWDYADYASKNALEAVRALESKEA